MILTDWGSGNLITNKYNINENSFISQVFIATFTTLIYIWTLIAPWLLPERNFYYV